ncbi:hypothetical protein QBC34DRAFT_411223 [Podospora aff. communis PSN243]|uniref:DUF1857 domain-containing protein n=1 Tax=Podospora aff. communis PSN243 TaxID=3040156 RepID=A0AAV9GH54_9PEZI|nr:hypothetical protein QBC34DRAFT_411223 [Podospora aff. communis PSN243]
MVVFNLGYTAPINPPGISPVLTPTQVWAGLERKVRHAEEFVPLFSACEVLSEEPGATEFEPYTVIRAVTIRPDFGPPGGGPPGGGPPGGAGGPPGGGPPGGGPPKGPIRNVCKLYAPSRVDFLREDGTKFSNYVTQGPSGEEADMFMTYVFEWRHAGVEEGSEIWKRIREVHRKTARDAVEQTIKRIRELVAAGEL